jgi:hypothetical protein
MDAMDVIANTRRVALVLAANERPFTRWQELKKSERDTFIKKAERTLDHILAHEAKWWDAEV